MTSLNTRFQYRWNPKYPNFFWMYAIYCGSMRKSLGVSKTTIRGNASGNESVVLEGLKPWG